MIPKNPDRSNGANLELYFLMGFSLGTTYIADKCQVGRCSWLGLLCVCFKLTRILVYSEVHEQVSICKNELEIKTR